MEYPACGGGDQVSSFDEPWKLHQEGEVGTQWGLWDKDERPKYGA